LTVCATLFTDQPTVDTVASSRKLSRLVSAGPSSPVDNIYTKFKLNFAIDSIQMELFTGDRDAVSIVIVTVNVLAEIYSYSLTI